MSVVVGDGDDDDDDVERKLGKLNTTEKRNSFNFLHQKIITELGQPLIDQVFFLSLYYC